MRMVLVCVCAGLLVCSSSQAQRKAGDFSRPVDHFAYAQGLKRGAIWDFAERAFRDFIQRNPGHALEPSAWSEMIDCQRHQDKHAEMLEAIEAFGKKWPKHKNLDLFIYWAGVAKYQKNDYAAAAKQFERLLKSNNDFLQESGTYLLADCLLRGDKAGHARAYDLLGKVAALPLRKDRPYRETAAFALGRHCQYGLKFKEAQEWFARLSSFREGNPALREEAMYLLGEIFYVQQDFLQACKAYDRYLRHFPRGKWHGEVSKRRAQATYMQRRFADALQQVLQWRKLHPGANDYEMDTLHGRCLLQLGEYAVAQSHFQVVVNNREAPVGTRRYCLVQEIFCLLQDDKTASWEQALELCQLYFKNYRDLKYEPAVLRYQGLLEEKLGRYEAAIASFSKALQSAADPQARQLEGLRLHLVQCQVKLKQWSQAAAGLRRIAAAIPEKTSPRKVELILGAGELELNQDKASPRAERDFQTALGMTQKNTKQAKRGRQLLLGIYLERKQQEQAHEQLARLIPLTEESQREIYLYKDALILIELDRTEEAAGRLRQALAKEQFADEQREIGMRLALLSVLQNKVSAGDGEAAGEMIEHYRRLAAKPLAATDKLLTPGVLYQMALLVAAQYGRTRSMADRNLLEQTYRRAIAKGYGEAAACFAGYRLGMMYMENGDGRYGLAAEVLKPLTEHLMMMVNAPEKHEEQLRQLDQGENLLRDALALLAECYYHLRQDLNALSTADQVLRRGMGYPAAKHCLLIQAKIYAERQPRQLEKALEKLARYQYTLAHAPVDPAEEEEVMVLLVTVQRELNRHEGASRAYRQLKVRYPQRAQRESWSREYETNKNPRR